MSDKATKIFIVIFALVFMFCLYKIIKLEKRYNDIDSKICVVESVQKIHEALLDQKIEDIKKLQNANDKKLKEVSNATFRENYQMSDDDVIAGWDNFMSGVHQRNNSRNNDK